MTSIRDSLRFGFFGAIGAAAMTIVMAHPAYADASEWSTDIRSSVRLIAADPAPGGTLRAGVEIKLQPGWKTYWRYPGDSGVPSSFDFAGSENLASAEVLYPAPVSLSDEGGVSIGYKGDVIFPVRVTPRDPAKPVRLKAQIDYAVCEKLCVPAKGSAELSVSRATASNEALTAAEARVPKRVQPKEIDLTAKRVIGKPRPIVYLDFAVPEGEPVEVFVEGQDKDWALPIPKSLQGAPKGRRHFSFELDGLPPGIDPMGKYDLTFTIVTPDHAFETTARLD